MFENWPVTAACRWARNEAGRCGGGRWRAAPANVVARGDTALGRSVACRAPPVGLDLSGGSIRAGRPLGKGLGSELGRGLLDQPPESLDVPAGGAEVADGDPQGVAPAEHGVREEEGAAGVDRRHQLLVPAV